MIASCGSVCGITKTSIIDQAVLPWIAVRYNQIQTKPTNSWGGSITNCRIAREHSIPNPLFKPKAFTDAGRRSSVIM